MYIIKLKRLIQQSAYIFLSSLVIINSIFLPLQTIFLNKVYADGPVPGNDDCDIKVKQAGLDCYIRGIFVPTGGNTYKISYSNGHRYNFAQLNWSQYANQDIIIEVKYIDNFNFNVIGHDFASNIVSPPDQPLLNHPDGGWQLGPITNGSSNYPGVNCDNSSVGRGCDITFDGSQSDPQYYQTLYTIFIVRNNINPNDTSKDFTISASASGQPFSLSKRLTDGIWSWNGITYNKYKNSGISPTKSNILIDTTAPSIPQINPLPAYTKANPDNQTGEDQITLSSSISSDTGIGNISYNFQQAEDSNFTINPTSLTDWRSSNIMKFASLTDGKKYFYRVRAKDSLNNVSNWSTNPAYSTQVALPPKINYISIDNLKFAPKAGTIKNTTIISNYSSNYLDSFTINIVDISNNIVKTYLENNLTVTSKTSNFTWDGKDTSNKFVSDGVYNIKVTVTDKALNQTIDSSHFVIVKNTPASISISNPADGSWFNTSSININGQTDQGATLNIKRCSDIICLNPIEQRNASLSNVGVFSENFNVLNGENIFLYTSSDLVGNTLTKTFKYYKETIAPVINSITPNNLINNNKPTISLGLNDSGFNTNNNNYTSGNDPTKTYLSITHEPIKGVTQPEIILVNNGINIAPNLGNIVHDCSIPGSFGNSTKPNCIYSFVFNSPIAPDGSYIIKTNVTDKANNKSKDFTQTFEIDSHTQNIISSPSNGQLFNYSLIKLTGTAEKNSTLQITGLSDNQTFVVDPINSINNRLIINNCRPTNIPEIDGIKNICDWTINNFQLKKNSTNNLLSNPIIFKLTDTAGNVDNKVISPDINLFAVSLNVNSDLHFFSPSSASFQNLVNFKNFSTNAQILTWKLDITNPSYKNNLAKEFTGNSVLPSTLPWDAKDSNNKYVIDGNYQFNLSITTTDNLNFSTAPQLLIAVTKIIGNVVITFPSNNYYTSTGTTTGSTTIQGIAPINSIVRICDSIVGLTNNCDFVFNNVQVDSNGSFTTFIPLYRLTNTNVTQHFLSATAYDKYGNITPDSNKVQVNVTNQTPFQNVSILPAYTGVNNAQNYQLIIDKLNSNQQITQSDITSLRNVIVRSVVSQGTERVKLSYTDRTNIKQLPLSTSFSNIGFINNDNLPHLYQDFSDGITPYTACNTINCTWDFYYPVPPIGGGLYEIQLNGKLGPLIQTETATFTIDGNIPAAPLILTIDKAVSVNNVIQNQKTNFFNNKYYSNSSVVIIKGVSDPKSSIKVRDNLATDICNTTTDSIGFWSCQVDFSNISKFSNLNTNSYVIPLNVIASLGANTNTSLSPINLVIDKIPPIINSLSTSLWHKAGDNVGISLTANKLLNYAIHIDQDSGNNCINASLQKNAITDLMVNTDLLGAIGSFSISGDAKEGRYCTKVEVADIAGNRTDKNLIINIDNTPPEIPIIDSSNWGIYSGIDAIQSGIIAKGRLEPGFVTKNSSINIYGFSEENQIVQLFINNSLKQQINALDRNSLKCLSPPLLDSIHDQVVVKSGYNCSYNFNYSFDSEEVGYNIQVKAIDKALNTSNISNSLLIYYDKTPPITPQSYDVSSSGKTINNWVFDQNQEVNANSLGTGNFGRLPITNQKNISINGFSEALSDMQYSAFDTHNNLFAQQTKRMISGNGFDIRNYYLNTGDGIYTFYSQSWDSPGNSSNLHVFQVELDTTSPNTPNVSVQIQDTYNIEMSINGEPGSFSTLGKLNIKGYINGTVKTLDINNENDWNKTESFCSRLTDRAGNSSSYSCSSINIPVRPLKSGECNLSDSQKNIYNNMLINKQLIDYSIIGYSLSCRVYAINQIQNDLTLAKNDLIQKQSDAQTCIYNKVKVGKNGTEAINDCSANQVLGVFASKNIQNEINQQIKDNETQQAAANAQNLKENPPCDPRFDLLNSNSCFNKTVSNFGNQIGNGVKQGINTGIDISNYLIGFGYEFSNQQLNGIISKALNIVNININDTNTTSFINGRDLGYKTSIVVNSLESILAHAIGKSKVPMENLATLSTTTLGLYIGESLGFQIASAICVIPALATIETVVGPIAIEGGCMTLGSVGGAAIGTSLGYKLGTTGGKALADIVSNDAETLGNNADNNINRTESEGIPSSQVTNKTNNELINETVNGKGNISSKFSLNENQTLDLGEKFIGKDYVELGKPGSGVFRSNVPNTDGTFNQFRIDNSSLLGNHDPLVPHFSLEIVNPDGSILVNNHIIIKP